MSFTEKCSAAQALLKEKGLSQAHYAPFAYRVLWKLGIPVPPPHFSGFLFNACALGAIFTLACAAISFFVNLLGWVPTYEGSWLSPHIALYGLAFGIVMAYVFRHGARKHAIPPWSAFHPTKPSAKS